MSYLNKYSVPFIDKTSVTLDNVVKRTILGGLGYLKIELPLNSTINECIGFKISVTSEDTKSLLFNGYISGSISEGYKWEYSSWNPLDNSINCSEILFCYKSVEDNSSTIIKSILLGSPDTNWGKLITISIEIVKSTSKNISELKSYSEESENSGRLTDGWNFSVGQITDESISTSISSVTKDSPSLVMDGVITGVASVDEAGNIVITTSFSGGEINLYNNGRYGLITADGSNLVGLENNESLKNMTFTSTGFRDPIIIKSSTNSDVSLNLTLKESGVTLNPRINVNKLDLGEWSNYNSKKFSVRKSTDIESRKISLDYGDLGLINNGLDSDLYVGLGSENMLVGSAKFCNNKSEFDSIDKVDGRIIVFENRLYVCNNGVANPIKFSGDISLDEIKNGYFYEKVNADAQLGGEIVRLKHDSGFILSNDLFSHMTDSDIHITDIDRINWNNKLDSSNAYTKLEVDSMLNDIPRYGGYHDPINDVVNGDTDFSTHNYPYGHRILVKEYLGVNPYIRIAGNKNEWLSNEEFNIGDKVVGAFDNFHEYINMNNKVVELNPSGSEISASISREGEDIILII